MKEIEVKAYLKNRDEVMEKLQSLGCHFSEPIVQNDLVFVEPDFKFKPDDKKSRNFLRIRKNNDKIIFTLKRPQSNELDCIEKELMIDNVEEMKEILKLLGYIQAVKINKTRIKCKYNEYEICIDQVDDLGDFVEVEKITDQDAVLVQRELLEFLQSVGVDKDNIVMNGYDTLMYRKLNK